MTCIAGLVHDGKVYIGGDSAGVNSVYDLTVRADEKVFRNGDFLFGFTSSFRMGQLLRYALSPPNLYGRDVMTYLCTDWINAVRDCLKSGGYARKENETESGGTFLLGFKGRLFEVHGDYQVGEPVDRYAAVGCGDSYAKGVLYASANSQIATTDPEPRILLALAAAERHSAGVRGPFTVLSV